MLIYILSEVDFSRSKVRSSGSAEKRIAASSSSTFTRLQVMSGACGSISCSTCSEDLTRAPYFGREGKFD